MSKLVDELMQEHKAILDNLDQIKVLGVTSAEGQKKLTLAKNGLLAHLRKEDQKLYPVLRQASRENQDLARTLTLFASDMDTISNAALAFFDKYAGGGSGIEFARDFGKLIATLRMRINKEEKILYRKFDDVA